MFHVQLFSDARLEAEDKILAYCVHEPWICAGVYGGRMHLLKGRNIPWRKAYTMYLYNLTYGYVA